MTKVGSQNRSPMNQKNPSSHFHKSSHVVESQKGFGVGVGSHKKHSSSVGLRSVDDTMHN